MPRQPEETKPCLVCKERKARYVNGCCNRCDALVQAEGTHDKYGVPKETKSRTKQRAMAAEYNELIKQRLSQKQIAELWGITHRQVSAHAYRWRRSGLTVAHALGSQVSIEGSKPKLASKTVHKVAEHGVGWGVTNCTCEPCKASRRVLRAQANRLYRMRRNARRKAERERPESEQ